MKNFGYCIWLVNKNKNTWEYPDKGFKTHLTIKSKVVLLKSLKTLLASDTDGKFLWLCLSHDFKDHFIIICTNTF